MPPETESHSSLSVVLTGVGVAEPCTVIVQRKAMLFSTFGGICMLFFTVAVPIYTPLWVYSKKMKTLICKDTRMFIEGYI